MTFLGQGYVYIEASCATHRGYSNVYTGTCNCQPNRRINRKPKHNFLEKKFLLECRQCGGKVLNQSYINIFDLVSVLRVCAFIMELGISLA